MTTVHQVFTIRSFRTAKDRDFAKAIHIYESHTHPQIKTDSREIAHWLHHGADRPDGRFYVCGLYISGVLVGFVEFIYLKKERLIQVDYFVIVPERRTAGAFHTFAEQLRQFFAEENLEWDFVSAEVANLDSASGTSRYAARLIRLFRQVGFHEVIAPYEQPLLGIENTDTALKATLLLLPQVEMESISKSRHLDIVSAIFFKHYGEWYRIHGATTADYQSRLTGQLARIRDEIGDRKEIELRGPEREFSYGEVQDSPPLKGAVSYLAKVAASAAASAILPFLLRHHSEYPTALLIGAPLCLFVLLVVPISLTDKKRFEAFKLLVSLSSRFLDR